tara:strand:+ start:35327 stop:35872 length:546 start_codon:yes stop_codon:yes gene_type:complete
MDSRAIINILVSFVIIGILILLYSVENTLWALYWILFTLYLMVFFSIGLKLHNTTEDLLIMTAPIILISFLVTWLIQIFSSKQELIEEDKMVRKIGLTEKVPNTFYNMYTGVLLLMIVKISLYVGLIRNKLETKENNNMSNEGKNATQTRLIYMSVYGMSIISFLLLVGMSLVSEYYITDG